MTDLDLPPKQIDGQSRRVPRFDWKIHLAGLIVAFGVLLYVWVMRDVLSREMLFAAVGLAGALVGGYAALLLNWTDRDRNRARPADASRRITREIEPR